MVIHVLKVKPLIEVNPQDRWSRILPMSFVFCINIVLGNVSLRYIPVSFMQTIKSLTPATTGMRKVPPIQSMSRSHSFNTPYESCTAKYLLSMNSEALCSSIRVTNQILRNSAFAVAGVEKGV